MTNKRAEKYGRILLPFVTAFDKDENVNYDACAKLIDYGINKGFCDSVIIEGTTGEFNVMSFEERVKLIEVAMKVINKRKPLIVGTGAASTRETIALTQKAKELGADMCMIVSPYYCKPTQKAIIHHFTRIAEAVDIDILVYNIPIFTGVNIEPETMAELAKIRNIVGVKDEAGMNPTQVMDYKLVTADIDPEFMVYNGDDVMLMPTIAQGSVGIVSGGSMLLGDVVHKVFEDYEKGRNEEALAGALKLYRMTKAYFPNGRIHPNPMLKTAITMVTGIDVGNARGPLDPVTDQERQSMKAILKEIGLLD
jgi:4-hydroxy-tetrahydrodipicolinate synthase